MIVQPTATTRRSRRSRAQRVAGFAVPPALLALVVLAGLAGPRDEAGPIPSPQTAVATVASDAAASPAVVAPELDIPPMFGDLKAMGPAAVLAASEALGPTDAIALAGWLGVDGSVSTCMDWPGGPYGSWCDRRGIIAAASWVLVGMDPFPADLRVRIPSGVRLPAAVEQGKAGTLIDPIPVLVVGRVAIRPVACQGFGPAICADQFIVDRVAWAGGDRMGLTPLIDQRLQTGRRPNPFVNALDEADVPLLGALVWPEDVWRLDSDAGRVAVAHAVPGEPVWYVRVLDGARGPGTERRVRWMLLSEPDLKVLANGRPGVPVVAGLPVTGG